VGGGLFSLSVATVLPLLKVMMGEEGLHGWVNRMIAQGRYGVRFYLPDSIDLSNPEKPDVMYHLRITSIESSSLAAAAGLEQGDMIVGAGSALVADQTDRIVSQVLLQQLVQVPADARILVQYRRLDESGQIQLRRTELSCGKKPVYSNLAQQLLRYVPSDDSRQHRRQAVISIIILMAVVTLVRCTARFYQDYTAEKVVDTALAELRQQAFEHSLYMPVGFFARRGSSDIVSRLVRDISSMGNGINLLLGKALREPFKAAGLIVLAVMIEPNLTLIFLCAAPLSLFVLSKLGRKMRQATKKSLASWAQMLGKLEEAITAVGVVKVYNRQEYEHDRFVGINKRLLKQQFRMAKVDAATGPILESLGMIAGSVALVFGAQWVYNSQLEPSSFFALLLCLGTAAETVRKTSDVWNKLQQSDAAAERVFVIMDEPAEQEAVGAVQILGVKDRIEFRDVCFSYPGTEKQVLQHINLSVCVGTNVAIVGPNGSGKTTLVNLLPRFYDTDRGQILIDGKGIRDISLRSLRDQIGLVTQQVVTFNDTIAANIAYGKLNAGIEQIVEAAGRAFADEFIRLLPKGYDSVIGEHGAGLSGGQLQRIVIARAILKNPAILIFDEATSQVDADSEAKIHQAIEQLMRGRTSFVIAHRLSTIVKADLIVVMDDGQIIAHGRHDQLLDRCSLYRTLYQTQLVKA
jgi:ABC-type multidrug transport system fused ATPase/permease subunit